MKEEIYFIVAILSLGNNFRGVEKKQKARAKKSSGSLEDGAKSRGIFITESKIRSFVSLCSTQDDAAKAASLH